MVSAWMPAFLLAQNEACMNDEALQSIFKGNLNNASRVLSSGEWQMLSDERNTMLIFGRDTLWYDLTIWRYSTGYTNHDLYFYHREGSSNFVEWSTTEYCYNQLMYQNLRRYSDYPLKEEIINNTKTTTITTDFLKIMFAENLISSRYIVRYYNQENIESTYDFQHQEQLRKEEELRKKKEKAEGLFAQIEILQRQKKYETAMSLLDSIPSDLSEYRNKIKQKKKVLEDLIIEQKITKLLQQGEKLFEDRNLHSAKVLFEEVLALDPKNEKARTRKEQIDKMLNVLDSRSATVYDYQTLNPDQYKSIKIQLINLMNQSVSFSSQGVLKFDFNIFLDTAGKNNTFYHVSQSTDERFEDYLSTLAKSPILVPTYKESILVNSKSTLHVDMKWSTVMAQYKKKTKKVKTTYGYHDRQITNDLVEVLRQDSYPNGKYTFSIKEKKVANAPVARDIYLSGYKTVGAEAALYSMLFPGLGTMIATQGEKGKWAMISFLAVGGGTGALYYLYQKERKSDTPNEKAVNAYKWSSVVCLGISGTIYIADVIHAFARGIKNFKNAKEMRKVLKNEMIEIQKEEVGF